MFTKENRNLWSEPNKWGKEEIFVSNIFLEGNDVSYANYFIKDGLNFFLLFVGPLFLISNHILTLILLFSLGDIVLFIC